MKGRIMDLKGRVFAALQKVYRAGYYHDNPSNGHRLSAWRDDIIAMIGEEKDKEIASMKAEIESNRKARLDAEVRATGAASECDRLKQQLAEATKPGRELSTEELRAKAWGFFADHAPEWALNGAVELAAWAIEQSKPQLCGPSIEEVWTFIAEKTGESTRAKDIAEWVCARFRPAAEFEKRIAEAESKPQLYGPSAQETWNRAMSLDYPFSRFTEWFGARVKPSAEFEKRIAELEAEVERLKKEIKEDTSWGLVCRFLDAAGIKATSWDDSTPEQIERAIKEVARLKQQQLPPNKCIANELSRDDIELIARCHVPCVRESTDAIHAAIYGEQTAESKEPMPIEKPPIGLVPKWRVDELRLRDIDEAIARYEKAHKDIPVEWLNERQCLRKPTCRDIIDAVKPFYAGQPVQDIDDKVEALVKLTERLLKKGGV